MAKVSVTEECIGCGLCVNNCPDCFELTDEGKAKAKGSECSSCDLHEVASQCPVNAIIVED